ncbi:hypothetical protein [Branchiibius sp. NY16-3462-2]|uniref:hypothetical protein n=1 Tax=Branchiibius sp. NY16-3462-2 TaxID=1807500 RepID=UPI00079C8707|nr:hypothetical protein [Branchiibius sp. NY16-3462-2]KYH44037.1 hypothetical protein AZH51_04655 [Branchiibius sp. NY16-3462-2]
MVTRRSVLRAISALPAAAVASSIAGCTRSGDREASTDSALPSAASSGVSTSVSPSGIAITFEPGVSAQVREQTPALVDAAASRVRSVWSAPLAAVGRSISGPRSVQVTATQDQFVALGGASGQEVAATTLADGSVVLAPDVWTGTTREGRIVVIAHELTHVVLNSQSSPSARWLVEGPPEWTAYQDTSLSLPAIAPRVAAAVRAGRPAGGPPANTEFTDGPLQAAYQSAFTWCTFLVQRSTAETFTAFVLDATDQSADRLPTIFQAHFGSSIASLVGEYQDFQRTTFGAGAPSA